MSPKEIINIILDQVSTFANGQPQRDDVTLLVMRVQGAATIEPQALGPVTNF